MGFGDAIKTCFSKYFTFSGRARRSEYWWFYLFVILLSIVAGIFDGVLGLRASGVGVLGLIASLATFIPLLSAGVRRLHDTGRSGWWLGAQFIAFIVLVILTLGMVGTSGGTPSGSGVIFLGLSFLALLIYGIVVLVFLCQDSHKGDNKYGPSPKYDAGGSVFS